MKTEANLKKCGACDVLYDPDNSRDSCPHMSRTESPKMTELRKKGPPYKITLTVNSDPCGLGGQDLEIVE